MTESCGERYQLGIDIRRKVMGNLHVEQALGRATDFSRPIQDLITEYAWGEIWGRQGLDLKIRSMLNIAMLVALNRTHELAGHIQGALNNGVSEKEIQEILLQTMIYCGAPAALESFRAAEKAIAQYESQPCADSQPT
ncbi:carboxymuconolactone decarboxylase family protein [Paenarthrobacter aromaticivorans]|uniref:carboxymuconolactone decarboxylase family protein n=1 Tax=Paenarthrobacter aromaticivorans TaxID=2849150 RepID=UPI003A7F8494